MNFKIENAGDAATLYLYSDITAEGASDLVQQLARLNVSAITLRVNSPGGDVFAGQSIYNALRRHPARVTAYVDGLAASAASFICMAADHVAIAETASIMIHEASVSMHGDAESLVDTARLLDAQSDTIARTYAAKAGGTRETWRKRMRAETWLTAQEAVDLGLADEVIRTRQRLVAQAVDWRGHIQEAAIESMFAPAPRTKHAIPTHSVEDATVLAVVDDYDWRAAFDRALESAGLHRTLPRWSQGLEVGPRWER